MRLGAGAFQTEQADRLGQADCLEFQLSPLGMIQRFGMGIWKPPGVSQKPAGEVILRAKVIASSTSVCIQDPGTLYENVHSNAAGWGWSLRVLLTGFHGMSLLLVGDHNSRGKVLRSSEVLIRNVPTLCAPLGSSAVSWGCGQS